MDTPGVIDCVVVGGGASGCFAALRVARLFKELEGCFQFGRRVVLLEASQGLLHKVRISGGGRCNVTHGCFDPIVFSRAYPRGERQLRGMLRHFGASDMISWLSERGVELKLEPDGRMFPVTDSSQTIIDCFMNELHKEGVAIHRRASVKEIVRFSSHFEVKYGDDERILARTVFMATGSSKTGHNLCKSLGHTITDVAPSLFTFEITDPLIVSLPGTSFPSARCRLSVNGRKRPFEVTAPLLITHWGLSGPAVLKLSALAARELQVSKYTADLRVSWVGDQPVAEVASHLRTERTSSPNKQVSNSPRFGLSKRFWGQLSEILGLSEVLWSELTEKDIMRLAESLTSYPLLVGGKGIFKEEFVTCGGVELREVNTSTMQSKITPGLFFGGELLDVDGITGGFNFQHAWTSAYIGGVGVVEYLRSCPTS